jgi:hypothetical protein
MIEAALITVTVAALVVFSLLPGDTDLLGCCTCR